MFSIFILSSFASADAVDIGSADIAV